MQTKEYAVISDFEDELYLYNLPDFYKKKVISHVAVSNVVLHSESDNIIQNTRQIFWGHKISTAQIIEMPNLEWIHLGTSGFDKIDLNICRNRKIIVSTSSNIMSEALATTALSFIFAFMRQIFFQFNLESFEDFTRLEFEKKINSIKEPSNCSILIYGAGQAGKYLSKLLTNLGFKVKIVSLSGRKLDSDRATFLNEAEANFQLHKFDIIVNLLPLRSNTVHYFNFEKFKKFSKNSVYISIGRGKTTCELDLVRALDLDYFVGAALDVFESEPLAPNSFLHTCKKIIKTPHIAGLSSQYWAHETALFLQNLDNFIGGKKLLNQIEPNVNYV